MDSIYDEEEWRAQLREWIVDTLQIGETAEIKAVVPTQPHAVLAFHVRYTPAAERLRTAVSLESDITALSTSLRRHLGPLARLTSCDARAHHMTVCVLEMPRGAMQRLESIVSRTEAMIEAHAKRSLRFHATMFGVASLLFVGAALALHNHWYAYDEPWEGPLEFIWYHLPFSTHPHTHTH